MSRATLETILLAVSATFAVKASEITGRGRDGRRSTTRHAFCSLAVEAGHSLEDIGKFLGRDFSTVSYGYRRAMELAVQDAAFAARVDLARVEAGTGNIAERLRAEVAELERQRAQTLKRLLTLKGLLPITEEQRSKIMDLRRRRWSAGGIARRLEIDRRTVERVVGVLSANEEVS